MQTVLIKSVKTINCIYQQQVAARIPACSRSWRVNEAYLKVLKKLCLLCHVPNVYEILKTLHSKHNYHLTLYHYYVNVFWRFVPKTFIDAELISDMCTLILEMEWYVRCYDREYYYTIYRIV